MSTRTWFAGLAVSLAVAGALAPAADAAELKASLYWGPKSPIVVGGYKPFIDEVEKVSNGGIKIRLFSGGTILDAKGTLPGLRSGVADFGTLALTYFPAELPMAQFVADLAMLGNEAVVAAAAVSEFNLLHCAPCKEEWTKLGLVYTGTYSTTPYILISKTPIETLADLRGKKVRSPGSVWDRWVEHAGAVPVNVSSSEMYEAFNRNVVDIVIHTPASLKSVNLGDFAKYVVNLPLGTYHSLSSATWNADTWKGMTAEERRTLLDHFATLVVGISDQYKAQDTDALKATADKVSFVQPSEELTADLKAFRAKDMDVILANAMAQYGVANPKEYAETLDGLFTKWRDLLGPHLDDRAKMEEIVKAEIFDKLDSVGPIP